MSQSAKLILILSALLILSAALFLTWNAQGSWDFVLAIRAKKLAALLLVAYAVGVSTLLFQTITNNPILTPSILGFDALYVFLQTALVAALGGLGYTQLAPLGKFSLELAAMLGGSLLLFSLLLKQGGRDLARMILIGVVFGVLFRSLSSLLQRMIDPEEFTAAQAATFASFNSVNTQMLAYSGVLMLISVPFLWRERHHSLSTPHAVDFILDCAVGCLCHGNGGRGELFWAAGVCAGECVFRQPETQRAPADGVFNRGGDAGARANRV